MMSRTTGAVIGPLKTSQAQEAHNVKYLDNVPFLSFSILCLRFAEPGEGYVLIDGDDNGCLLLGL